MKGVIKFVPVEDKVYKGMQVLYLGLIYQIMAVGTEYMVLVSEEEDEPDQQVSNKNELKIVVVEYEKHFPHAGVSKKGTGPGVGKHITGMVQLLLKLNQWGQVADGEDVEFQLSKTIIEKVENGYRYPDRAIMCAEIAPPEVYSKADLENAYKQGYTIGSGSGIKWYEVASRLVLDPFKEWLQYYKKVE